MQNTNNPKLLNKFNELEGTLDDKNLKYSISKNEIARIKTNDDRRNEKIGEATNVLKDVFRISKKYLNKTIKQFDKKLIHPISATTKNTINEIKTKKAKTEVKVTQYIKTIETDFDKREIEEELKLTTQSQNIKKISKGYESAFPMKNVASTIVVEEDLESFESRLLSDLELMKIISKRMIESKMDQNLFGVSIESMVDQKTTKHKLTFELKSKGLKWALFFAKYISKELNAELEKSEGTVHGEHVSNVTLGRDKFVLSIEHATFNKVQVRSRAIESNDENSAIKRKSLSELGI